MNPSEEAHLKQEIQRLREQIHYIEERHSAALDKVRSRIAEIENKISGPETEIAPGDADRKQIPPEKRFRPAVTPPPLPPKPKVALASPSLPIAPSPAPLPEQPEGSFELDFGKVWFVRIGIVILLTGLVFLGNYAYQNWIREMPNGVRLAALFACALGLAETGRRLAAKENLRRFGEVLLAGGMAFFYYCTFAANHVERLKVIESPVLGALLIFGAAGAISGVSWLRKTQATAILGIVLASYSTMLQPIGWMSCFSAMLLGLMGLFFMLKPGWAGPGWASMLGSYGAFFGWQLLGASGENVRMDDTAVLWFLPPQWVLFAIPGVLGRFRESLSDRARAWFTAANNALFFLLFSAIWLHQNGDTDYWLVAAIFGPVLILLGTLGRRQEATAGGVNISQGIAVATFALVLKLEGQNLALVLAFESFALAVAAWKFRGKSEAVFSLLAGLGSTGLIVYHSVNDAIVSGITPPPVWSLSLVALLLLAASRVRMLPASFSAGFDRFPRASAAILFTCAAAITTHLCLDRLDGTSGHLTAIMHALALSVAVIRVDPERKEPEFFIGALWFLILSVFLGFAAETAWPPAIAACISLVACWLWHRTEESRLEVEDEPSTGALGFSVPAWAFSLATAVFAAVSIATIQNSYTELLLFEELAALALAAIAIALGCKRLLTTASGMALLSLVLVIPSDPTDNHLLFLATLIALAAAFLTCLPWSRERIEENYRASSSWIFRTAAFFAYCTAWHRFSPANSSDWLALTSIVLTLLAFFMRRKLFAESVGLITVGLATFFIATASSSWQLNPDETGWRGVTVVLALLALILTYRQRPALIADPATRQWAISMLAGLTCAVTTLWATQMLVWRFGWKPAAVLWTLLGFGFVSAGLWQRLHILRVCGFLLLVVSFVKLFAVDVWDFTAFMRVVSFIVLGAALILLGLFYNKFAVAIKALLDDEKSSIPRREEPDEEESELG